MAEIYFRIGDEESISIMILFHSPLGMFVSNKIKLGKGSITLEIDTSNEFSSSKMNNFSLQEDTYLYLSSVPYLQYEKC